MATHQNHTEQNAVYFVTFACHKWLPLFELTNTYSDVYNWFDILISKKFLISGYAIMPNHIHMLLYVPEGSILLNKVVGNGKRFLAYGIVSKLRDDNQHHILQKLSSGVYANEKRYGKKHRVFNPSFDARLCESRDMTEIYLDYIHMNPVRKKWRLVEDYIDYSYSSAAYYEREQHNRHITHYGDIWEML